MKTIASNTRVGERERERDFPETHIFYGGALSLHWDCEMGNASMSIILSASWEWLSVNGFLVTRGMLITTSPNF